MPAFRIVSSQAINRQFLEFCEQADRHNRGREAIAVAETLMAQLQVEPLTLGEAPYHLKVKGWPVCHCALTPWSIHFVVDEQNHVVYVSKIALLE
jgi:hypothetical protein